MEIPALTFMCLNLRKFRQDGEPETDTHNLRNIFERILERAVPSAGDFLEPRSATRGPRAGNPLPYVVPTYLRYARCLSDAARPTPASVAAPLLRGSLASSSFAVALVPLLRRRCWGSPRGRDGGGSEWYVALGARSCLIVMFFRGGFT